MAIITNNNPPIWSHWTGPIRAKNVSNSHPLSRRRRRRNLNNKRSKIGTERKQKKH